MRGTGVDGDQPPLTEPQRHRRDREVARVESQRVAGPAEERRELVEETRLRADPVVLDPGAEARQHAAVGLGAAAVLEQRERERHLERGGRREPGPARHVAADRQLGAPKAVAGALQLRHRPAHEGCPPVGPRRRGQLEGVGLAELGGARANLAVRPVARLHRDPELDRERQAEPVVVVGVLADQVDAPRPERADGIADDALRRSGKPTVVATRGCGRARPSSAARSIPRPPRPRTGGCSCQPASRTRCGRRSGTGPCPT